MNGILNILKPPEMTSFDVVAFLRRTLKTKKIGHTGTLDPAAVGVLPICIGNATKTVEYITSWDKVYRAELTLGICTDTQDSSGQIVSKKDVDVDESQIRSVIKSFIGKIGQVPPMYSAIKYNGTKLYELARKGITIERKVRDIEIYSIDIININQHRILMDVWCSKGTYIRTLCADIGEKLGCGGNMSFLLRMKSGIFDIDTAITLEEVEDICQRGNIESAFTTVDRIFVDYKRIDMNEEETKKILNGVYLEIEDMIATDGQLFKLYDNNRTFIALGETIKKCNKILLKAKRVFK